MNLMGRLRFLEHLPMLRCLEGYIQSDPRSGKHQLTHFQKNVWQNEIDPMANQSTLQRVRLLDLEDVSFQQAQQ
jgi:hypothetical protein